MKLHNWQDIRKSDVDDKDKLDLQAKLDEIAKKMVGASPKEQARLSKELDRLLGTKVEESPDPDLESYTEEELDLLADDFDDMDD